MPLDDTWTRAAATRPNSFDPETRSVEAVIATTHPVPRRDAKGDYLEVFDFEGMDLSEVVGLPVLDSHRTGSIRDTIGCVEAVRLECNQLIATLRFSSASDVEPVMQCVEDGSARGVSVGYRKAREIEKKTARGREKILTPRLTEVTLTSNPADPSARLRQKGNPMPETLESPSPEEAETQRRSDIRGMVRSAGLGPEVADQLIDHNADMTAAKVAVFDALEERRRTAPVIRVHASSEDPTVTRKRMADAIAYQMGGLAELPEPSRDYAGMTMPEMMRDSLERSGTSTRSMSKDEMLHRSAAHGTSDFVLATMDAAHLTAMAGYKAAEPVLKVLARKQTVTDFKPNHSARFGEMGQLAEMAENGEFTATSFGEEGEMMAAKTYGRRIDFTRQLIINSQFDVAGHAARAIGEAAGQTEAALLTAQLT